MRVLIGSMVRQHPSVLAACLRTLQWQDAHEAHEIDYFFVDDNDDEASSALLVEHPRSVIVAAGERGDAVYAVEEHTHQWSIPSFYRLAHEKQRILDYARANGYDGVFLVDSDLLLAPDTLRTLIENEKEISSAVFWTQWTPGDAALPQVWQVHPYGFDGAGWTTQSFLRELEQRQLVRVRGLGACTFIRRSVLDRGAAAFTPLLSGLPSEGMWQGEDRHFCVRAERAHVEMYADAWPFVWHCYRPSDRERIGSILEMLEPRASEVRDGAWVRFTVEPCEEPQLALYKEHVRGRIGELRVLPEIEQALREMRVGEARFVSCYFPLSWPIDVYRNSHRTLRVRLLGVGS